jgi:hypothetical protein
MTRKPAAVEVCPSISFTRDTLRAAIVRTLPKEDGEFFILGDYALTCNPKSDHSAFVLVKIVMIQGVRNLFVIDCQMDKWDATELAYQLVMFALRNQKKYGAPIKIRIERLAMYQLLDAEVSRQLRKRAPGQALNITWFKTDKKKNAKPLRIAKFQKLLETNRAHFLFGCGYLDEIFEQFCQFTAVKGNHCRKDDAADCCGMAAELIAN